MRSSCASVIGLVAILVGRAAVALPCPYSEPASDYCEEARVIPGTVGHHVVLMDASTATGMRTGCTTTYGKSVWFEVTPEVSGWITVSTCHPNTSFDTVLQVYFGGDWQCEGMTPAGCEVDDSAGVECTNGCSGAGSTLTFSGAAGSTYRIEVGAYENNQAACPMCLGLIVTIGTPCGEVPRNLACEVAKELPGTPGTHAAAIDVEGAAGPFFQPNACTDLPVGHSVWFQTTPTVDGSLTFSTCNTATSYDTVVQAFAGSCDSLLQVLECADDSPDDPACDTGCQSPARRGSKVTLDAVAGTTYYFQVSSYNGNSAGCDLCLGVRSTLSVCTDSAECDDGDPCTVDDCQSGLCVTWRDPGAACPDDDLECTYDVCDQHGACIHPPRAAGDPCGDVGSSDCDGADRCDGFGECSPNLVIEGTPCTSDGNACTDDRCDDAGVCDHMVVPDGTACGSPNNTVCDNPDTCTGGQCEPNWEPAWTLCRDAVGPCDAREGCTGSSPNCPADVFFPFGTECRPATGACDVAEACSGDSPACPGDRFAPTGLACPDDGDECTEDVCDGTGSCTHPAIPGCCPSQYECCQDADCDDGIYCNGPETCRSHGCYRGAPPCAEGFACVEEDDRCGPDCNGNGADDGLDIAAGRSLDTNRNGVPDECEPPTVLQLLAIEDATVDSTTPNINWGARPDLVAGWEFAPDQTMRRSLIKFPPLTLPPNAHITNAVLELHRLEGQPGVLGRIVGAWSEYEVTWDHQPGYGAPTFAQPTYNDPDRWDVTPLVAAWHSGLFPNDGLALLETVGAEVSSVFISKEGGAPARLFITYAMGNLDFDPLPPPGLGPPNLAVDHTLLPFAETLEPMMVDGMPVAQPLAALQAEQDSTLTFVADQVIVTPGNPQQLQHLLSAYGGRVLRQPGLPAAPPQLAEFARHLAPEQSYLVQVDPRRMDPGNCNSDAAALGMMGDIRVSSDLGLRLLALVFREHRQGLQVGLNAAGELVQTFPPLTLDEDGLDDPINDAATYPELSSATIQRTGVSRAWQYMAFATRATPIRVAIIDGGFCLDTNGGRCTDAGGRLNLDLPAMPLQFDIQDDDFVASGPNQTSCGDSPCPHHGSETSSMATATQDNDYGIAGIGSPVAEPMLFKVNVTMFQAARAIRTATAWGADITSMSFSIQCGWYCTYLGPLCGYTQMKFAMIEANDAGVLTVAAAGNNNLNLNDEFRIPCQFAWTGLCVGALANNSLQRANFSNWGWKGTIPGSGGVGIFAPGTLVRVGPNLGDANNHDSSGTSLAAPFVAGAAALARAVNPNLTDDQIRSLIMTTAIPAVQDETQPGSIDVLQVVLSAGPPHTDMLGSHSGRDNAATLSNAGLQNLTITPAEVDYFVYDADNYLTSVRVAATYVEPIGDLFIDSIDPTAARLKLPAVRTTSVQLTSLDLCAGDSYSFFVRGVNPAVGNAYDLTVLPTAATMLTSDAHEPNNSIQAAAPIPAPHESSMDILSTDPIDCRHGLTLHHPADVDQYAFTVQPDDLDATFTGVSIQIHADFPLTATLFHEGVMLQSATQSAISLDVPVAQPGSYSVEVRGTALNAYTMRARIYDPEGRVRAWELEDWLKSQLLPDPPEPLPDCLGGCPPMPPWMRGIPFDPETLIALHANGVTPLTGGSTTVDSELGEIPALFVLGSTSAGEFHLLASLAARAAATQAGAAPALHALLLDADGTELWRAEGLTGPLDYAGQLEPRRSYLLLIAGPQGAALNVVAQLPPMAGDTDSDGDTDLRDFAVFQRCFGVEDAPLPTECASCDLDSNGLIDLGDVPILVGSMTHPH